MNGIIATDDKNIVTISLPKSVIAEINQKAVNNTPLFKAKLYFLIWLINRGDKIIGQNTYYSNSYQLHIRAHKKVFTTKNELEKLIQYLVDNQLIEVIDEYGTDKKKARTYRVTKAWEIKNKSNELIHFDTSIYTFAKHFQALNYLILPQSTKRSISTVNDVQENKIIKELLNKIEALEKEVTLLKGNKEQLSTATIEEFLQDDSDIVEEEIEIINEPQPTIIEDNTIVPPPKMDDYYRVIDAYYNKKNNYDEEGIITYAKPFRALKVEILIERINQVIEYQEYLKRRKCNLKIA